MVSLRGNLWQLDSHLHKQPKHSLLQQEIIQRLYLLLPRETHRTVYHPTRHKRARHIVSDTMCLALLYLATFLRKKMQLVELRVLAVEG